VISDADVLPCWEDDDRGEEVDPGWAVFDAVGHVPRKGGEPFDDPLGLRAEVDVARSGKRRLFRAGGHEELDGSLERVEQLTNFRFLLGAEDRHLA
jgi:hypothetical protein